MLPDNTGIAPDNAGVATEGQRPRRPGGITPIQWVGLAVLLRPRAPESPRLPEYAAWALGQMGSEGIPALVAGLIYCRYLSGSATKLASTMLSTRLTTRLGVLNVYRCELTVTT